MKSWKSGNVIVVGHYNSLCCRLTLALTITGLDLCVQIIHAEWDALQKEERLHKQLRCHKITQAEFHRKLHSSDGDIGGGRGGGAAVEMDEDMLLFEALDPKNLAKTETVEEDGAKRTKLNK